MGLPIYSAALQGNQLYNRWTGTYLDTVLIIKYMVAIYNLRFTVFIALLSLWLAPPLSNNSRAQTTINEYTAVDSLSVGDTFDFSITLDREGEFDKIIFPDTSSFAGAIEMRSRTQFKPSAYKDSIHYRLQSFATSDTVLPALPVHLINGQDTTTLYTNSIPIGFRTVLAKDDDAFRPLKPIFDFAVAWWPYILGFLLLCAAAYILYRYFTREEPVTEEPPIFAPTPFVNPLSELRNDITALEDRHPQSKEEFKDFYIELGDAIRRYFEELHQIPAMESTSGEILQKLRQKAIDNRLLEDTRAVLREADIVKFANFTPSTDQAQQALRKAHDFLDRAEEIDSPRVEQLERNHQQKMEQHREQFQRQQAKKEAYS
ncbi:MAG TPA: hypothetical protein VK112_08400 [Fodinibius sp.]|nr:hypothetical protein [Fodinibius sp.]